METEKYVDSICIVSVYSTFVVCGSGCVPVGL